MQQEIIQATGTVAGQVAANALKNTHCTITLTGWPAAFTILGSVGAICLTIGAIVYITTPKESKQEESYGSYEV